MLKCQTLLLIACLSFGYCMPLQSPRPTSKSILISPDTVKFLASYIDSSATITDLTIQFGTGTQGEELLRVPIAGPGELGSDTLIRITLGMNPPATDNDPAVGITDGVGTNQFWLLETAHSSTAVVNPCDVANGSQNGRTGPAGNPIAGGYTLLFDPFHRFGSCTTNKGFNTDGRFNTRLDISKGLSLILNRDNAIEGYFFHYFLVELL